jgi:CHAT domain-containing protein
MARSRQPIRLVTVAVLSIALLLVAFATWRFVKGSARSSFLPDARRQLLRHLDTVRLFEPRVVGPTTYRPVDAAEEPRLAPEVRGGGGGRAADAAATLATAALYRGQLDEALDLFGDAVYAAPRSAEYWSDLAAASLVRHRPTDLLIALDAAELALEIQPDLDEARFNRALALERLGLLDAASTEWQQLADSTKASGWAAEARDHATAVVRLATTLQRTITLGDLLETPDAALASTIGDSLDDARQRFEDELVPRIGQACRGPGPATASCAHLLTRADAIARALAEISPDRQLPTLGRELTGWHSVGTRRALEATMLERYGEARRLADNDQISQAADLFSQVLPTLRASFPALAANAEMQLCMDAYFRADHAHARECLSQLEASARSSDFLFLLGRIDWVRAQVSLTEANFARALNEFDAALAHMQRAKDRSQSAAVASLKATLLDQLGELNEAWGARIAALTRAHLSPRRRHTLLNSAGRSCMLQRLPRAALRFQTESVHNAFKWSRVGATVESLLNRALVLKALGRTAPADVDIQSARRQLQQVSDLRLRGRFESELTVAEGELLADTAPERALDVLRRASSQLAAVQFTLPSVRLQHALGIAYERLGRAGDAVAAYRTGIEIIERQRDPLAAPLQAPMLDAAWDTYERFIVRQLRADPTGMAALTAVESSRAHVLRTLLPGTADPFSIEAVQRSLPDHLIVIIFSVLEDEIVRWTLSRTSVDVVRIPLARKTLEHLVLTVQRALHASDRDAIRRASVPLFNVIVPRGGAANASALMVMVPDGALHQLPVAALIDPATGKYLAEEHPLAVTPSLTLFLSASASARHRFGKLDSALVVQGASGTIARDTTLSTLPATDREIRAVAASYPSARLLVGATATPAAFLLAAGSYPVVHFAGHAVANRLQPELSRLYLSSANAGATWLTMRDLESGSFPRTALVVLSACETAVGPVYRGEGVISLARPFLAKGVAGVVNTLWDVDDAATARLMQAFHARVSARMEPALALQAVQREAIARDPADGHSAWAAFQYIGGVGAFDDQPADNPRIAR